MTPSAVSSRFVHRYLDPGERLGEILFGLIMVLTFTLTARATLGDVGSDRALLIAALGCNIAWGIIDGGMFIMSSMLARAREARAAAGTAPPPATRVTGEDLKGALACAWLVVASTIPVAVPFMIIDDDYVALRTSNALLLALLFLVGFAWGHYANTSRWVAGTVCLMIGLILVTVAIALGG